MSVVHYDYNRMSGTITTSSKAGTMNLKEGMAEDFKQIICVPAISNNMYTFQLVNNDDSDMVMWERAVDGTLNELVSIPVYGFYKVRIINATSDDTFKVRILYR